MAVSILATSFGGLAAPAHAQDIEFGIDSYGRPIIRERDRDWGGDRDWDRDRRWDRRRGCSEREARRAARDAGFRRPEVVRVTPRRVVVEGWTRRGFQRIVFANIRGCPEI
ncbi:MAG: hypothetical protein QHC90_04155 [Shinella sp.]|nr:hypothetical protein [Shinella sp.]